MLSETYKAVEVMSSLSHDPCVALRHTFGANLRQIRKAEGLSQEDLMGISGVHRTLISEYERGIKEPRIEALLKLARAMNISTEDFWIGVGWQTKPPRLDVEPDPATVD